jgi:choline kinase
MKVFQPMKAVMLAAGVGRRLYGDDNDNLPKALLEFDGRTLFERHVRILLDNGIDELVVVVGHRKEDILAEADRVAPAGFVRPVFNPRYKEGPILSLWAARQAMREGGDVLFMDADVLYHPEMMNRLLRSPHRTCFIIDRDFEPGAEPVKLCIKGGVPVDFGKKVTADYEIVGEWPGFLRMSADIAGKVAAAAGDFVRAGRVDVTYEEAMRAVLVSEPPGAFAFVDITGIPWIEIDFPSDLLRAEKIVYPLVSEYVPEAAEQQASRSSKASGE